MFRKQFTEKNKPSWWLHKFRIHTITYSTLVIATFILVLCTLPTVTNSHSVGIEMPCQKSFWWDHETRSCEECTICDEQMVVLRPCQAHKDTLCGTINDLEFDWKWLARTEKQNLNWKERRKETQRSAYRDDSHDILWDWQTALLGVAAFFCFVFILIVLYISLHQIRQLKKIQKRLNKDYQELYATLAEVQQLENGAIIIEDVYNKEQIGTSNPIEVQCIYLEQLLAGKKSKKTKDPGNIYIEDASTNSNKT